MLVLSAGCRRRRIKVPRVGWGQRDLRSAAGHLHAAIAVLPLARRIPLGAVGSLRHHIHWVTVDNSPPAITPAGSPNVLGSLQHSEIVAEHGAAIQHGCGRKSPDREWESPGSIAHAAHLFRACATISLTRAISSGT